MRFSRVIACGLIATLLLGSSGLFAAPCAAAAVAEPPPHHHHAVSERPSHEAAGHDCCARCAATCGMVGCSAMIAATMGPEPDLAAAAEQAAAGSERYCAPPPPLLLRPPIRTL